MEPVEGVMSVLNDSESTLLFLMAREGDEDSFERIYENYRSSIRGYIKVRADSEGDIEEIELDAWKEIFRDIRSYEERWSPYAFMRYWTDICLKRHYGEKKKRCFEIEIDDQAGLMNRYDFSSDAIKGKRPSFTSVFDERDLFDEQIRIIQWICGDLRTPHMVLAFMLKKVLSGWTPERIIAELGKKTLKEIVSDMEIQFAMESNAPLETIDYCFGGLRRRLEEGLGQKLLSDFVDEEDKKCFDEWIEEVKLKARKHFLIFQA